MSTLAAAVLLLAVLTVFNLVLLLATARRLRMHSDLLSDLVPELVPERPAAGGPAPGEHPAPFSVTAVDGEPVDPATVRLVGFLSQGCRKCQERLPRFLETARTGAGDRRQVLAVVVGDSEPPPAGSATGDGDLAALTAVAQVVMERRGGPLSSAFGVTGFPMFCTLGPDGRVLVNGDAVLTG